MRSFTQLIGRAEKSKSEVSSHSVSRLLESAAGALAIRDNSDLTYFNMLVTDFIEVVRRGVNVLTSKGERSEDEGEQQAENSGENEKPVTHEMASLEEIHATVVALSKKSVGRWSQRNSVRVDGNGETGRSRMLGTESLERFFDPAAQSVQAFGRPRDLELDIREIGQSP